MKRLRSALTLSPRTTLIALGVVIAALAGTWYWHVSGARQETDNAYVNARIVQVSSLVMGQVVSVPVKENQYVHQGDILFELDRRPFETALAEAEGKLRQAEQGTRQDQSDVLAAQADVARFTADLGNAEANLRRTQQLVQQNFMSRQAADDARARVDAPILGPTIGGWLTETIDWRWNFYINVPIGVLSFLLAARHVPDTPVKARGMDWLGLAYLAMFVGALQYLLDRGQQEDWFSAGAIRIAAVVLVAALALFVVHSVLSKRETLLNIRMFADRNFTAASIVGGAMGLSLFGGMLLQPVLFENLLQYPTFDTGLAMMPRGIGSLISMLIVGRLVGRLGAKPLIYFGIATGILGAWMMTHVGLDASASTMIIPLILQGIGVGFVFVPLSAVAFATLPKSLSAEAAGVYSLIRSIGSSIGISIVSVSMTRGSQASWGALRGYVDPYRPEVQQYLNPLHLKAQGLGLALIARETATQAQMLGLLKACWVIVASFVVMVPLVMLLKPAHGTHASPATAIAE